jgi:ABC-type glycerol-3-phosphate transport system substrate-binding protein
MFSAGREAMRFENPSVGLLTIQNNPSMNIGLGKMFTNPQDGVSNAIWIGGWDIALTATSKNSEAAYRFMHFLSSDPVGVAAFCESAQFMPSNIKMPYFRELGRDPQWKVFTEQVVSAVKFRPAIPSFDLYNTQLASTFDQILAKKVTPEAGLETLSKLVDAEMAEKFSK